MVTDVKGNFLFVNTAAESIVGMGATDSPADQWSETYGTFYPDRETPFPSSELPLMRAMRGEVVNDVELFIRNQARPQGVYISVNARPFHNDSGELNGGMIVLRNINKLKETEEELRHTVHRLQDQTDLMETVFNSIGDGVIAVNEKRELLTWNSGAKHILGIDRPIKNSDQWAKKYGIFYPDGKTQLNKKGNPFTRSIQGEWLDDFELVIRNEHKPQGIRISLNARPLRRNGGRFAGGLVTFRDVTHVRNSQAAIAASMKQLKYQTQLMETVFNSISDGVIAIDRDGEYLIFNATARRIIGMQVPGVDLSKRSETYGIFSPDGEDYFPSQDLPLTRAIRGESTDNIQLLIRNSERPEGVYISVDGRPLWDGSGRIKGGVIVFRDVTENKETEIRLKESAKNLQDQTRFMETIFNSISDGVVVADETGDFHFINRSAERMIGVRMKGTSPDQWSEKFGLFFPDRVTRIPTHELPLTRAINGQSSDEVEIFVRNPKVPDGIFMSVSGRPLRENFGVKGGVVVLHDVTERMHAEEALTDAFAQGRLEIVDTILHNIGNAINSVVTGVGTLHEQLSKNRLIKRISAVAKALEARQDDWVSYLQTDPQGRKVIPFILVLAKDFARQNDEFIETITRVENRVEHIIDIIQTQKSFENTNVVRKDVYLSKMIADSVKLVQDGFHKRNIDIRVDCENAPSMIKTQESKFHQMLINLLKNGIEAIDEFTNSGGLVKEPCIEIRTYTDGDFLVLDVTDNGIGIRDKHSRIIFRAGYTTKKTGTGLGLHSIANFVIGSGGEIYPLSAGVGAGTTMRVRMRLTALGL